MSRFTHVEKTTTGALTAVTFKDKASRLFVRLTDQNGETVQELMSTLPSPHDGAEMMHTLEGSWEIVKNSARRMIKEVTLIPHDKIPFPEHKMSQAQLDELRSYGPEGVPELVVERISDEIAEREWEEAHGPQII